MQKEATTSQSAARSDLDLLRARQYGFLASVLSAAPSGEFLAQIVTMSGDDTPLGQAYGALARRTSQVSAATIEREFFELFIGVGRGELLPYASFYLTGFLNERPLADLRSDMASMGIERSPGRYEPEDHIAFVCEVMANLASGQLQGEAVAEEEFFQRHVAPWGAQFFDDLAIAPSADFYRPVAEIGRLFVDIEARAFSLGKAERVRMRA